MQISWLNEISPSTNNPTLLTEVIPVGQHHALPGILHQIIFTSHGSMKSVNKTRPYHLSRDGEAEEKAIALCVLLD